MMVLIVDDNPSMRQAIRYFLGDLADFHECSDGAQAVDIYRLLRPDWVLMDVRMPIVDGIAATRQIIAADSKARILIVTDYDDKHLRSAASNAGACGYVLKDDLFSLRQLLSAPANQRI